MSLRKKVLLVDDHALLRRSIIGLIEQEKDLCVCGEAEDSAGALRAIETLKPDIALVDISLNGNEDGLDLIKTIKETYGETPPSLAVSLHEETLYIDRALRAGARGYLMKMEAPDHIVTAIREVLAGRTYVSPQDASKF